MKIIKDKEGCGRDVQKIDISQSLLNNDTEV